ncbi:uncharacterized protein E0L32_006510 [Thyridium curvatum]|uniref:Uncharacterized protein n=1 Tax=Thyridium curvatum TaxID=1093900 RepID=A0A507B2Y0_9PEZI|nr:uncharacterized protein E0L32_006510 [Thyridium curvatum]TPX13084.1 hypothetical protein E0L32_006510 [Thyridium curvatum]
MQTDADVEPARLVSIAAYLDDNPRLIASSIISSPIAPAWLEVIVSLTPKAFVARDKATCGNAVWVVPRAFVALALAAATANSVDGSARPATWTNGRDLIHDGEDLEDAGDQVHFVNVSPEEISALLHVADGESPSDMPVVEYPPHQAVHRAPRLLQSRSGFDLMLGDHDSSSLMLLDYYTNNWCRRKVIVDGPDNGYRQLVLPVLPGSSSLKHAILALAAFDYPQQDGGPGFRAIALRHKSQCLRLLQQNIQKLLAPSAADVSPGDSSPSADFHETVLTTLIMCISEITTGSTKEWVTYLRGASALFEAVGRRPSALDHRLVQFARQYFLIRDVFSCTALHNESYFAEQRREATALWADLLKGVSSEPNVGSEISVYVGCSERLVAIISSITALARRKAKSRKAASGASLAQEQEFLAEANALQCRLDQLREECLGPEGPFTVGDDGEDDTFTLNVDDSHDPRRVVLFSLLFKRAAQLYLRHAGFDIPVTHPSIQQVLLPSLLKLFQHVEVPEREVYPMWPLFIASCMAVTEKDRRTVLDQFGKLRQVWTLGNIGVTESSVHWVWKWHDIALDGRVSGSTMPTPRTEDGSSNNTQLAIRTKGTSSSVDWDAPLRRLGWRISLT